MKKFVVIAALLVLVGVLFAEEAPKLTVTGEFQTGVRVELDDAGNTAQLYSDEHDVEGVGAYAELNGAYAAENYGIAAQLTFGDTTAIGDNGDPAMELGNAYGWMSFIDKKVTIKAGLIDETAFDNVGDQGIYFFNKTGLGVTASPIAGLTFGASAGVDPALMTGGQPMELSSVGDKLAFGVAYSTDKFVAEAGYTTGAWSTDDYDYDVPAAYAQLGITAIENLTLEADALFIDVANFSDSGEFISSETVGYVFGKINPSIVCTQDVSMADSALSVYSFEPELRYLLNESFEPYIGGALDVTDADNVYSGKIGFSAYASENAVINAFYQLSSTGAANAFQLDFSWYF